MPNDAPVKPEPTRLVSPFEADLLHVLYTILGEQPLSTHISKFTLARHRPTHLSQSAAEIIADALAKGMTSWLIRSGGWRVERFLSEDGESVQEGRVWQRHPVGTLSLEFTSMSLDFLMWLTSTAAMEAGSSWRPVQPLSLGDELLIFRTAWLLRTLPVGSKWLSMYHLRSLPLMGLVFQDADLSQRVSLKLDFTPWLRGAGAAVLECFQDFLADRMVQIELQRSRIRDTSRVLRVGKMQMSVLKAYMDACQSHRRRDLCRFLLQSAHELHSRGDMQYAHLKSLDVSHLRMAERTQVVSAASSFQHVILQLQSWTRQCAQVGYFDEGFAAAQLWMADWERYDGDRLAERSREHFRIYNILDEKESSP